MNTNSVYVRVKGGSSMLNSMTEKMNVAVSQLPAQVPFTKLEEVLKPIAAACIVRIVKNCIENLKKKVCK